MKSTLVLIALGLSAAAFAADVVSDRPIITVPLADPSKPVEIRIELGRGDVDVRGTDDSGAVYLQSSRSMPRGRKDGLRVITSSNEGVSVRQHDNVVYIAQDISDGKSGYFEIRVPRSSSVVVNSAYGSSVGVENISGNVEIRGHSKHIHLRNLSGGTLVEAATGNITATYPSLPSDKAISFTSMNGKIEIRVPADAKANVHFRTHNGDVLTDFEDAEFTAQIKSPLPTGMQEMARAAGEAARAAGEAARAAAAVAREQFEKLQKELADRRAQGEPVPDEGEAPRAAPAPPKPPRSPAIPAISGGKVVTGTLNGGGTEIQIATMNGDIVLRKHAP